MTFAEFRAAVLAAAPRKYTKCQVTVRDDSGILDSIVWSAYVGDEHRGRIYEAATPESVLAQMRGATEADIAEIGEVSP